MTDIQVFDGDGTRGMLVYDVFCESWLETKDINGRKVEFWWTSIDPAERNVYLKSFRSAMGSDVKINVTWKAGQDDELYDAHFSLDVHIIDVTETVRQKGIEPPQFGLCLHAQQLWWPPGRGATP